MQHIGNALQRKFFLQMIPYICFDNPDDMAGIHRFAVKLNRRLERRAFFYCRRPRSILKSMQTMQQCLRFKGAGK